VPIPVISVGNHAVGGAGKTPFSAWLIDELLRRGERPALVHGGYADDEPALHALWHPDVPVIADRDRVGAARRAAGAGATIVVLDDAMQHRRIVRDLDIALVSAEQWDSAPRLLPRGPWREPPSSLRRVNLVAVTRKAASEELARDVACRIRALAPGVDVVCVTIEPAGWMGREGAPGASIMVTGVAQPDLFAENARANGAVLDEVFLFPDHYAYARVDAARILAAARGRAVVTTAKDWVKLRSLIEDADLWVLEQRVRIDEGADLLEAALTRVVA
jgi:tetraacyldisaccharide 4'-kinase